MPLPASFQQENDAVKEMPREAWISKLGKPSVGTGLAMNCCFFTMFLTLGI
jgi:hypothetical protein